MIASKRNIDKIGIQSTVGTQHHLAVMADIQEHAGVCLEVTHMEYPRNQKHYAVLFLHLLASSDNKIGIDNGGVLDFLCKDLALWALPYYNLGYRYYFLCNQPLMEQLLHF